MKFTKNGLKLSNLNNNIGMSSVLRFNTGFGFHLLLRGRLENKVGTKKGIVTTTASSIIKATCLINIYIIRKSWGNLKKDSIRTSSLKIT